MTNTTSCSAVFGAQYCESDKNSNFLGYAFIALVIVAAVFIGLELSSSSSVIGSQFLDGSGYVGY